MPESNDREKRNEVFHAVDESGDRTQLPPPVPSAPPSIDMYDVPVENVPLPSDGRVYDGSSPFHNRETVEIRAMTAKDEDILTSRALVKKGIVIDRLIESCLLNCTKGHVGSLLIGDRNAVMISLRITGYGSTYTVSVSCPSCGENSKQDFDLTELQIKRLSIDPVDPGRNRFEFVLPRAGIPVHFRFLTGNDERDLYVEADRKKKHSGMGGTLVTSRLKRALVSVAGEESKGKIAAFIEKMSAADSRALRKFMDENEPGIDMTSYMSCESCFESSPVRLPMGASFFWPDTE